MAASRDRYNDKKLIVYRNGTNYDTLVAKFLSEYYGNNTAMDEEQRKNAVKNLFHLDILLPHNGGFLGGCKVSGSDRMQYHNDSRKGLLCVHHNGVNYKLFNDSGINTRPYIEFQNIPNCTDNSPILCWANSPYCIVRYKIRSAYYAPTTRLVVDVNGAWEYEGATLVSAGQRTDEINVSDVQASSGSTIVVGIAASNEEGDISVSRSASVGASVDLSYNAIYQPYSGTLAGFTPNASQFQMLPVYMFTSQVNLLSSFSLTDTRKGVFVYTSILMNKSSVNNKASAGMYDLQGDGWWYKVDSNGEVLSRIRKTTGVSKAQVYPVTLPNGNIGIYIGSYNVSTSFVVNSMQLYTATNTATGNPISLGGISVPQGTPKGRVIPTNTAMPSNVAKAAFNISPTSAADCPKVAPSQFIV